MKNFAKIISEIFNGFITMILAIAIPIQISDISTNRKILYISLYISVILIPYYTIKKLGKISDRDLSNRKERPLFFTILAISFGVIFHFISKEGIDITNKSSLALFATATSLAIVTFVWKMSGHMTYSTLLFTTLSYISPSPYTLLLYTLTPLIAWSRIKLSKHTFAQVVAGTYINLIICILIYWIF